MKVEDNLAKPEQQVARVTLTAEAEYLPPALDFVRQTARRLGLQDEAADHLKRVVEAVCRNVLENAFGPDEVGSYDVYVLRRPGQIVVAVEDRGMPGDYNRFESGEDSTLRAMLHRSFADEARFINLGRGGNRVELVKDLPHTDARERLSEEARHETAEAPTVSADAQLDIRMMRPEDSPALSRSVYRSYGYSYDWDDIYYPDRVRELQESGLMRSCVAVSDGEIVGHLAVIVERPDSSVGEAGQAVVDPRFRGHHLFERMKTFLAGECKNSSMYGLYSEATAIHPYSQKGNLRLGARETGYLLGYIPASVSYKDIGDERSGRRGSVALMYLRVNDEPGREIYPPAPYEDAVRRVVEHHGLRRTIAADSKASLASSSQMSVDIHREHNIAFLRVIEPGADLEELVRIRLRELCLHRVDCVYVDLPLSNPVTSDAGDSLAELGFFFGCIIPEDREGDVLRLQYLNNVEIDPEDVRTASDFGRELLDLIFSRRDELERQGIRKNAGS